MKEYIITSRDYAKDGTAKGYLRDMQKNLHVKSGISVTIKDIDKPQGRQVKARIWQGQWIADCDICNSASFIDPQDPLFFCFGCGNRQNGFKPRPVKIPKDWEELEGLLLARPVNMDAGLNYKERAALSKPLIVVEGKGGLARNWDPGESLADIRKQNEAVDKWKKEGN